MGKMTRVFAGLLMMACGLALSTTASAQASHTPGVQLRPLSQQYKTTYALLIPLNYTEPSAHRWPLIVALHYKTGNGNDYLAHWQQEAEARHYFVFAPDARDPNGWSEDDAEPLIATLRALCAEFPIDKKRILVTGTSAGGNYTYYLASRYPEWFRAAAPIAAARWWFDRVTGAPLALRKVRFCLVHGAQDRNVPAWNAEQSMVFLRRQGLRARLMMFPNEDHYSITPYRQILEWFESLP